MREYITKEEALMALTGQFELGITMQKYSASCQKHIEAIQPKTEQEIVNPYLDKIRAEIENHCGLTKENHCKYCSYCNNLMGVREILELIDKYRVESEG